MRKISSILAMLALLMAFGLTSCDKFDALEQVDGINAEDSHCGSSQGELRDGDDDGIDMGIDDPTGGVTDDDEDDEDNETTKVSTASDDDRSNPGGGSGSDDENK